MFLNDGNLVGYEDPVEVYLDISDIESNSERENRMMNLEIRF